MKYLLTAIVATAILSGCATTRYDSAGNKIIPASEITHVRLDNLPDGVNRDMTSWCGKAAQQVRSVAMLREIGLTQSEVMSYTNHYASQSLPYLVLAVYLEDMSPGAALKSSYDACHSMGYGPWVQAVKRNYQEHYKYVRDEEAKAE